MRKTTIYSHYQHVFCISIGTHLGSIICLAKLEYIEYKKYNQQFVRAQKGIHA